MRVTFAGTPDFAARCLETLLQSRHEVVAVLTRPDRPAGRGLVSVQSPVKRLATSRGIQFDQPVNLKTADVEERLSRPRPDVIAVVAYGLILPPEILAIPRYGAVNIHASLLPRWRGAAPIQRALLAGDAETGISIMQMDAGLDTGPVWLREGIPITKDDTTGTLHDSLAELGGKLVIRVLDEIEAGTLTAIPQSSEGISYAAKLDKRESRVDWHESATQLNRRVRAFNPSPGAGTRLRGVDLKIWRCSVTTGRGIPGEVLHANPSGSLVVACGEDAVILDELQRSGGKRLLASEFLRGFPVSPGEHFDT